MARPNQWKSTRRPRRACASSPRPCTPSQDAGVTVAADAVEALLAGEAKIITESFKNKVIAGASAVRPDAAVAKAHVDQVEPTDD